MELSAKEIEKFYETGGSSFPWSIQDLRNATREADIRRVNRIFLDSSTRKIDYRPEDWENDPINERHCKKKVVIKHQNRLIGKLKARVNELEDIREKLVRQFENCLGQLLQERTNLSEHWQQMPGNIHPDQGQVVFAIRGHFNTMCLAWYNNGWWVKTEAMTNAVQHTDDMIKWFRKI